MKKGRMLLVVDPIPVGFSVQFRLLLSLSEALSSNYDLSVFSNYIAPNKRAVLENSGIKVFQKESGRLINFVKEKFFRKLNESLLWGVNWFLDILSFKMGHMAEAEMPSGFDYVINLSATVVCKSDILWIQGPPFIEVVESMSSENFIARLFLKFFRWPIINGTKLSVRKMAKLSRHVAANSQFIASRYENYPFKINSIIYSSPELSEFKPCEEIPEGKYVLTYIGKETDLETIFRLSENGIKVVGFGAKIPPGFKLDKLKNKITFLGSVSKRNLIKLYGNALFVAFPFTNEPFGWVPIESMMCGTPVLSYNREGPSETILDGKTGWLVSSSGEFVEKAIGLWNDHSTGIQQEACIDRGKDFTVSTAASSLNKIISPVDLHEISSFS